MANDEKLSKAVQHFWTIRNTQQKSQGQETGIKDYVNRSAVTGGRHLDGFISLLADILIESGLPSASIHTKKTTLPGYFRPTKDWVEEALGSSLDLLTAYREGKFKPSNKPWLGWLMLLEDSIDSTTPVRIHEPHFEVFQEFKNTSYAKRYELFCERIVRERLYDSACFLLSNKSEGLKGKYTEPNEELSFKNFITSLSAHAMAYSKRR